MAEGIITGIIVAGAFLYIIRYYRKLRKDKRCTGCSFSGDCRYENDRDKRTCSSEETRLKDQDQ